jgi:hypothetical protein
VYKEEIYIFGTKILGERGLSSGALVNPLKIDRQTLV